MQNMLKVASQVRRRKIQRKRGMEVGQTKHLAVTVTFSRTKNSGYMCI